MALSIETVNGQEVLQVGSSDDNVGTFYSYTDASDIGILYNGVILVRKALYIPNSTVDVVFENGNFIFENSILFEELSDYDDFKGIFFKRCSVIYDPSYGEIPDNMSLQIPHFGAKNGSQWRAISKTQFLPIKYEECKVTDNYIRTGTSTHAFVISHAVNTTISTPARSNNYGDLERYFFAAYSFLENVIIENSRRVVINNLGRDQGVIKLENITFYGEATMADAQGVTIIDSWRFEGRDNETNTRFIDNYYGSTIDNNRALICFINMTFLIDGGVTSSNTTFPALRRRTSSNLLGLRKFFLNKYSVRVLDTVGVGVSDVKVLGFLSKTGENIEKETALDFSYRYNSYRQDTTRYGTLTNSEFSDAADNIIDRLDDNFSLDGAEELTSNDDGEIEESINSDIINPEFRVVELKYTSSGTFERTNYDNQKLRFCKYGFIPQEFDVTVGYDTEEDASIDNIVITYVEDSNISESDISTVLDYENFNTIEKVYDRAYAYIYDNRTVVDLDIAPMVWSGTVLDIGDYNIHFAADYDEDTTYNTDDITLYDNKFYACQSDSVTGMWDDSEWTAVDDTDEHYHINSTDIYVEVTGSISGRIITTGNIHIYSGSTVRDSYTDADGKLLKLNFDSGCVYKGYYVDADDNTTDIPYTELSSDGGSLVIPVGSTLTLKFKEENKQPEVFSKEITDNLFDIDSISRDQLLDVTADVDDVMDHIDIDYDESTDKLTITINFTLLDTLDDIDDDNFPAIIDRLQQSESYLDLLLDEDDLDQKSLEIRDDGIHIKDDITLVFTLGDTETDSIIVNASIIFENDSFSFDTNTPKNSNNHRVILPRLGQTISTIESVKNTVLRIEDELGGLDNSTINELKEILEHDDHGLESVNDKINDINSRTTIISQNTQHNE